VIISLKLNSIVFEVKIWSVNVNNQSLIITKVYKKIV